MRSYRFWYYYLKFSVYLILLMFIVCLGTLYYNCFNFTYPFIYIFVFLLIATINNDVPNRILLMLFKFLITIAICLLNMFFIWVCHLDNRIFALIIQVLFYGAFCTIQFIVYAILGEHY